MCPVAGRSDDADELFAVAARLVARLQLRRFPLGVAEVFGVGLGDPEADRLGRRRRVDLQPVLAVLAFVTST
jgi:hypothetical protein